MKNILTINVDSERENQIILSKPSELIPPPQNKDEVKLSLINDIKCLTQALKQAIIIADNNGYAPKKDLVDASIRTISEALEIN